MPTDRTFEKTIICDPKRKLSATTLRYLGIASVVDLPKGLLLGRMVVSVTKEAGAAGPLMLRAAPRKRAARRRRGGKKK